MIDEYTVDEFNH